MAELLLPSTDARRSTIPERVELVRSFDVLWMFSFAVDIPNTPMWVGFNSKFSEDFNTTKQKNCYLRPVNSSPIDKDVVLQTLKDSQCFIFIFYTIKNHIVYKLYYKIIVFTNTVFSKLFVFLNLFIICYQG